MRSYVVRIYPDGRVDRVGVDTGKTTLAAINEDERLVAFNVAGRTTWICGYNPRQYVPAHISVFKFTSITKHGVFIELEIPELFGDLEWDKRK